MEYFTFETRGLGLPTASFATLPRGGDVLVQERGRHAQSNRDIVKASDLDVLRQDVRRFTSTPTKAFTDAAYSVRFRPLDRHIARLRTFGMRVERVLHPGNERIDILLRRLGLPRWRHQTSAQLAQGLLPNLRILLGSLTPAAPR